MSGPRPPGRPPSAGRPWWRRAVDHAGALREQRAVAAFIRVMDRYGVAGGAILAGGLAYSALFAIVPAILLLLGLSGTLLAGQIERDQVSEVIGAVIPPLEPLLRPALSALARDAASLSVVGLVTLVWGAGGFARSLEVALTIMMGEGEPRGFVARTLIGIGSVVVIILAVVGSTVLAGLSAFVQAAVLSGAPGFVSSAASMVAGLTGPAIEIVGIGLVYRFVPPGTPHWRSIAPPALAVGLVIAAVTRLFVELAPRLIGAAAALGAVATAFGALAWFGITFQALLIGASWVADREERRTSMAARPVARP
jgi:membrane protein